MNMSFKPGLGLPRLTPPAAKIWSAISSDGQNALLQNAWCSKCRQEVAITDVSGSVKAGNVLLVGTCAQCGGAASRLVEVTRNADNSMTVVLGKPKLSHAESSDESNLVMKESKALFKRRRQLERRSYEGTITKAELRELNGFSKNSMNEMLKKMMVTFVRLADSIDR
jgi:hypothetical protein